MDGKIRDVEDMPVYQCFHSLAVRIEKETRGFGPDFRWLRIQVLRSSESVIANLTEGFYAQYSTEYLQSLFRCRREARETMTHLRYARDVQALQAVTVEQILPAYEDARIQLARLVTSIEYKIRNQGKGKPAPTCLRECPDLEYGMQEAPVNPDE